MKKKREVWICFHGTNEKAARKIVKEGFRPWTHFAAHIEDALAMGGPYVFLVRFYKEAPNWQFLNPKRIPPSRIWSLTLFSAATLEGDRLFQKCELDED